MMFCSQHIRKLQEGNEDSTTSLLPAPPHVQWLSDAHSAGGGVKETLKHAECVPMSLQCGLFNPTLMP